MLGERRLGNVQQKLSTARGERLAELLFKNAISSTSLAERSITPTWRWMMARDRLGDYEAENCD